MKSNYSSLRSKTSDDTKAEQKYATEGISDMACSEMRYSIGPRTN